MDSLPYSFEEAYDAWERIPVDDFDYLSADEILGLHPKQLKELTDFALDIRWSPSQWRNLDGKLAKFMDPGEANGKIVMDFGCGLGLDALIFAQHGANVILADIHPRSLLAAHRVLMSRIGRIANHLCITQPSYPYFICDKLDLFWSFGVIHHTPFADKILKRACEMLKPNGVCKVILYSDKRWETLMHEPVPGFDTWRHSRFREFAQKCDANNIWADWYSKLKLERICADFAVVESCDYISNDQFVAAVIRPKEYSK